MHEATNPLDNDLSKAMQVLEELCDWEEYEDDNDYEGAEDNR